MSMNSSTGFKKRSLLRPPSGMLSNQREFLKVADISQSEAIFASNIRSQVASIQEQINLIDQDKKIRTGQSSLEKGYILSMKRWLKDSQAMIEKEDDDGKILKQMGVDSYQNGFRKLWKILLHLDLIISKVTELQAVSFIQYDHLFNELSEDSPHASRILQKIAKGGFNQANFQVSQLILGRSSEIFASATKLRRQGSSQNSSRGFSKQTKDDTNSLIQQLRGENKKLVSLLEQLEQTSRRQKAESQKIQVKEQKISTKQEKSDPDTVFSQVEAKYTQKINQLNTKISKLNHDLAELKIHCNSVQTKLKVTQEQLADEHSVTKKQKPKAGSYQQALLEEMNKMKNGFQRKIQRIIEQYSTKQRQMRKKQYEYRTENDRIKWQKGLLMKKFESISAC